MTTNAYLKEQVQVKLWSGEITLPKGTELTMIGIEGRDEIRPHQFATKPILFVATIYGIGLIVSLKEDQYEFIEKD